MVLLSPTISPPFVPVSFVPQHLALRQASSGTLLNTIASSSLSSTFTPSSAFACKSHHSEISSSSAPKAPISADMVSPCVEVVIAMGSNIGDRVGNFERALSMMKKAGVSVICHSGLYESAPAYVTDQPMFINAAVRATTSLDPNALLKVLKSIEKSLGRVTGTVKYGPRPIDLDILFYGNRTVSEEHLTIPHPLIWERPFVLAPLMDLHNTNMANHNHIWTKRFERARYEWQRMGCCEAVDQVGFKKVVPISGKLWSWRDRTYLMGILNLTPDSFSDGGRYVSVQDAVAQAEALASAGADIIDLGAQSTRPNATKLSSEEELARLMPVLRALQRCTSMRSVWLSVDTFYSKVAREAVMNGVDMVNDVSGGTMDPDMYATVAELGVPYVLTHMRGDPATMQKPHNVVYEDVIDDVARELCDRLEKAESAGVPAWRIIIDPGIGFSKTVHQNIRLLGNLSMIRTGLTKRSLAVSKLPMLIGPSRKGFLGKLCGREKAEHRDTATIGAAVAGVAEGADIIRLHNIKGSADAIHVANVVFKPKSWSKTHQNHVEIFPSK